jgi:hypothetical protein
MSKDDDLAQQVADAFHTIYLLSMQGLNRDTPVQEVVEFYDRCIRDVTAYLEKRTRERK